MKYLLILTLGKLCDMISNCYWLIIYSRFRMDYLIDKSFQFNGKSILFYGDGKISAGPSSYVGGFSTLQAAKAYSITIGKKCKISHNVRIYTQSAIADFDFSLSNNPQKYGDVTLEDYCWIGANAFISPGVTIGTNSVVGANSVVTKSIPPNEIWGGVPAKLIRRKKNTLNIQVNNEENLTPALGLDDR